MPKISKQSLEQLINEVRMLARKEERQAAARTLKSFKKATRQELKLLNEIREKTVPIEKSIYESHVIIPKTEHELAAKTLENTKHELAKMYNAASKHESSQIYSGKGFFRGGAKAVKDQFRNPYGKALLIGSTIPFALEGISHGIKSTVHAATQSMEIKKFKDAFILENPEYASREKEIESEYKILKHISPVMTTRYYIARDYVKKGLDNALTEDDIHKLTATQHGAIRPKEPVFGETLTAYQTATGPFIAESARLYGMGPDTGKEGLISTRDLSNNTKEVGTMLMHKMQKHPSVYNDAVQLLNDANFIDVTKQASLLTVAKKSRIKEIAND